MSRRKLGIHLTQGDDEIWYAGQAADVSYPKEGHNSHLAVEDHSFWFLHRNACIVELVRRHPPQEGAPIFDIGGGNGFVSLGLERAGFESILVEPGASGARNAKLRGIRTVICSTAEQAGFEPESLPAAGLFDVVEHVEDDGALLESIFGLLQPGGLIYLTVPAYSWLWSQADVEAGHFRRYTRGTIVSRLQHVGFDVQFASYFFQILPLPILLLRSVPYRLGVRGSHDQARTKRDHKAPGGFVSSAMKHLQERETRRINTGKPMRFGGSIIVAARKPFRA